MVEIAIRYTRVSTNDSVDVLVPNSEFVNGRVTNWTFDDTNRRIHIPFSAAYGTDKESVRAAGVAAARRIDGVIIEDRRAPEVWLVAFGDSSLNFELVIWVTHPLASAPGRTHAKALWALEDELRARYWDRSTVPRHLSAAAATTGRHWRDLQPSFAAPR